MIITEFSYSLCFINFNNSFDENIKVIFVNPVINLTCSQLIDTRHCKQDLWRLEHEGLLIGHRGPLAPLACPLRAVSLTNVLHPSVELTAQSNMSMFLQGNNRRCQFTNYQTH